MGSNIVINGVSITGKNVQVINNRIIVDGKDMTPDEKEININIDGHLNSLDVHNANSIVVQGDVTGNVKSHNGDVQIGGFVMGDVESHNGNISCSNVQGSVKTKNGNIQHKK